LEIIICLLDVLNNEFGEVDEAMIHGVVSYFLDIVKSDLDEVA
jgi:hypothetical protein